MTALSARKPRAAAAMLCWTIYLIEILLLYRDTRGQFRPG